MDKRILLIFVFMARAKPPVDAKKIALAELAKRHFDKPGSPRFREDDGVWASTLIGLRSFGRHAPTLTAFA